MSNIGESILFSFGVVCVFVRRYILDSCTSRNCCCCFKCWWRHFFCLGVVCVLIQRFSRDDILVQTWPEVEKVCALRCWRNALEFDSLSCSTEPVRSMYFFQNVFVFQHILNNYFVDLCFLFHCYIANSHLLESLFYLACFVFVQRHCGFVQIRHWRDSFCKLEAKIN